MPQARRPVRIAIDLGRYSYVERSVRRGSSDPRRNWLTAGASASAPLLLSRLQLQLALDRGEDQVDQRVGQHAAAGLLVAERAAGPLP